MLAIEEHRLLFRIRAAVSQTRTKYLSHTCMVSVMLRGVYARVKLNSALQWCYQQLKPPKAVQIEVRNANYGDTIEHSGRFGELHMIFHKI